MKLAELMPLMSTSCIVISACLVAIGWYLIRRGKRDQHKKIMIWASIFAVLFFIIYVSKTIFVGTALFGGPPSLKPAYTVFLLFHTTLATVAAVMGLYTLYLGFKGRYQRHKKMGPWTAVIWFFTAITGAAVYSLLYVIYPHTDKAGLIEGLFGW
jgi:putative membrane protein